MKERKREEKASFSLLLNMRRRRRRRRRREGKNHHNSGRSLSVDILRYIYFVHTSVKRVEQCICTHTHTKNSLYYSRKRRKKRKNGVAIVHRRPMVKSSRREIQLGRWMDVYIYVQKKKKKKKKGPIRVYVRVYSLFSSI